MSLPIDITRLLLDNVDGGRDLATASKSAAALSSCTITRKEFEAAIRPLCSLVKEIVSSVVTDFFRKAEAQGGAGTKDGTVHGKARPRIDEIILVGGTSHVPVVRKMVRAALNDCGVHWYRVAGGVSGMLSAGSSGGSRSSSNGHKDNSEASQASALGAAPGSKDPNPNPKRGTSRQAAAFSACSQAEGEFCCSIDPHEAVAQGLAIRGGVLMGVDQGKLKDILILDVTPKSLGVLSTEVDKKTGKIRDYFEPVLLKSTQLPARGVCKFRLEKTDQRFVTVEVYEEIDELVLRSALTDDMVTNSCQVMGELGAEYVFKYQYRLMCTYDFPVGDFPVVPPESGDGGGRFVYVEITMSEEGDTAVRVLKDPYGAPSVDDDPKEWSSMMMMLVGYLVALGLLYLVVKIFLPMHNYPTTPAPFGPLDEL